MALIIRHATGDDLPELVELGHEFAQSTPYSEHFADDQFASIVYRLLSMETAACFVAEKDGHVIGFIFAVLSSMWFNQTVPIVGELAWWVSPEHRGRAGLMLLKELEGWAAERKAVVLSVCEFDTVGGGLSSLLERRGFTAVEKNYYKKFDHADLL